MTFSRILRSIAGVLALCLCCSSANASLVTFALTGSGTGGTTATASFTIEDGNNGTYYAPGYFANGSIYHDASVTLSNIPGGGPSSFTSDLSEFGSSWFQVDGSGEHFIAPYGGHNFGPPFQNHYDLGQPSQPNYPGSYVYQSSLSYNGQAKDLITWTPAEIVPTPEPGSLALLLSSLLVLAAVVLRRRSSAWPVRCS